MPNGRLKTASFGPGFIGVAVLFCGFAAVAWLFFRAAAPTQTYEEKRAENRREKAAAIAKEAQEKLYGPAKWIDQGKDIVQLPIDRAMELVANDYQSKEVQASAVAVEDPYPAGLGLTAPVMAAPPSTAAPPASSPAATPVPAASPAAASSPEPAATGSAAAVAASPTPEVTK